MIGDVGGHSRALARLLERHGVRFDLPAGEYPTGQQWRAVNVDWPEDLVVVSVGDLVHRGPDSDGVIALVDHLMILGRWVQVVGNHEQLYVDRPVFGWPETISDDSIATLRRWWAEGRLRAAAAITTSQAPAGSGAPVKVGRTPVHPVRGSGVLVTHAGLTYGFWRAALGEPRTALDAAASLTAAAADGSLWLPGAMLGYQVNLAAGPVWAEAGTELLQSWALAQDPPQQWAERGHVAVACPFDQVHGHSSAWSWYDDRWLCPDELTHVITVDKGRRHVTGTIAGTRFTGIDPGHSKQAAPSFEPIVYAGNVT